MRTAFPPNSGRRRPHPARRARKLAGALSVAGMVLLTGCMAVAGKTTGTTATSRHERTDRDHRFHDYRDHPHDDVLGRHHHADDHDVPIDLSRRDPAVLPRRNPIRRPMPAEPAGAPRCRSGVGRSGFRDGNRRAGDRRGRPPHLVQLAQDRIADLERRWSRFVDGSEISTLNRYAGAPVVVSPETVELVRRAIDAWRLTHGRFDPTVLGAVLRAGYDRSFETLGSQTCAGSSDLTLGAGCHRDRRQHRAPARGKPDSIRAASGRDSWPTS